MLAQGHPAGWGWDHEWPPTLSSLDIYDTCLLKARPWLWLGTQCPPPHGLSSHKGITTEQSPFVFPRLRSGPQVVPSQGWIQLVWGSLRDRGANPQVWRARQRQREAQERAGVGCHTKFLPRSGPCCHRWVLRAPLMLRLQDAWQNPWRGFHSSFRWAFWGAGL